MNQTRAEWQSERDERNRRTGEWGFDPGMPWSIANWRERAGIVFFRAFMFGVFVVLVGGGLCVVGMTMDGIAHQNIEYDRCLRQATNGLEIQQCR